MPATVARRTLLGTWSRRGALAWLLWPLSLLYRVLYAARRILFSIGLRQVHRLPVPVIVVGNVVAGGAGKTPVVIAIVRHLQRSGLQPGVVSRGYGRDGDDNQAVSGESLASEVGDEPLLIQRSSGAPVQVAPSRAAAARALLQRRPDVDVLVADDGLQHLALARDIEICVFDGRGVGNGFLLPAGPLREPWPRPVDFVLAAGDRLPAGAHRVRRSLAANAVRADGSTCPLQQLGISADGGRQQLWAVAGIAQPDVFFAMLREQGVPLERTLALADHARFDPASWSADGNHVLVCTEKDAVKIWRYRPDAWAVPLEVEIDPEFWSGLDRALATRNAGGARAKLSSGDGHPPS